MSRRRAHLDRLCQQCGRHFRYGGVGRPRICCSDACRRRRLYYFRTRDPEFRAVPTRSRCRRWRAA